MTAARSASLRTSRLRTRRAGTSRTRVRARAAIVASLALVVAGALVTPGVAQAAETSWTLQSPDGAISAAIELTGGQLGISAERDGARALDIDSLGLVTSAQDLSAGLTVTSSTTRTIDETYTMVTGKAHARTVKHNELRLEVASGAQSYAVVVRASHDGLAYNYELPGSGAFSGDYTVESEATTFTLPTGGATAWVQPFAPNYENDHVVTTVTAAGNGAFGFPALFRTTTSPTSDYVFLTESNVTGTYAATHLTHSTGAPTYGLELYNQAPVTAHGALTTPWRLAIIGGLGTIVDSTMVDDLADPSHLTGSDTSWIKPGTSAWSWNMNRGHGPQGDLALQKTFVDLAAQNGWPYTVIDEGWQEQWVPELVRYANARGVDVIAWFHSNQLQNLAQRTAWFDKLNQWGVKGIKVDFMDSDSQAIFRWYDAILAETAARHLMINFHGATLPKGMQRSWPQIMSYEGVRGEENGRSAQRNTILPFTRNVVGSMDYTPVVFSGNNETSQAQELALPIIYESGWTHFADNPSAYNSRPVAQRLIQQIPAAWDETRFVSGDPGQNAILARRSGERWFVGGIVNGSGQTLNLPLTMLSSGDWLVHEITDNGTALDETIVTTDNTDTLTFPTVTNGGFAVVACPATPGRTSCYAPVVQVPATSTAVATDSSTVGSGDIVTVSAIFQVSQGGPVSDVELAPQVPESWRVLSGGTASRATLGNGEAVSGTWQLRVGNDGPRGSLDLTVAATFTAPDGRQVRSAGASTLMVNPTIPTGDLYLSDLEFTSVNVGYGSLTRDADFFGNPLNMLDPDGVDTTYAKGIEVNSVATVVVRTAGVCQAFTAHLGLEQSDADHPEQENGTITFEIRGDGGAVLGTWGSNSAPIGAHSNAIDVNLDISGVQQLTLYAGDAGNGNNSDHAVFGNAQIHCTGATTDTISPDVAISTSPAQPSATGWFTSAPTVIVTAEDADPELFVEYSTNDGATWQNYTGPFPLADGDHHVRARATDSSDNVSPTLPTTRLRVDTAAPTISADVDLSARQVTIGASDATAGVSSVEYRIGSAAGWSTYTTPIIVGGAETSVSYRATDAAGNVSPVATATVYSVNDPTPGFVATSLAAVLTTPTTRYGAAANLRVRVTAARSMTASGTITVRDGSEVVASGTLSAGTATLRLPRTLWVGTHTLTVSYAGNGTLLSATDQVKLTVKKGAATVTVKVSKITRAKKGKVKVKVRAATTVTGKVKVVVKKGTKKIVKKTVTVNSKGVAKVRMKKLSKKGTYRVKATYRGSSTLTKARTKASFKVKR